MVKTVMRVWTPMDMDSRPHEAQHLALVPPKGPHGLHGLVKTSLVTSFLSSDQTQKISGKLIKNETKQHDDTHAECMNKIK